MLALILCVVQTGKAFDLAKDTVACAIHFMDQYLSELSVDKIMLQLLSMVCMYVSSKMHESQPISMVSKRQKSARFVDGGMGILMHSF